MHTPRTLTLAVLAAAALLGACGGGSDTATDGPAPPADASGLPDAATASTAALTQWAGTLAADDHAEPMGLAGVELPVSETGDPAPLGS